MSMGWNPQLSSPAPAMQNNQFPTTEETISKRNQQNEENLPKTQTTDRITARTYV